MYAHPHLLSVRAAYSLITVRPLAPLASQPTPLIHRDIGNVSRVPWTRTIRFRGIGIAL